TRPRSAEAAERSAQLDGMVRACAALRETRADAIRLFVAHAQPAHQPREPSLARPRMAGERGDLVRAARRRERDEAAAADVRAHPFARARASEPYRHLTDVDVFGERGNAG